MLVHLNLEQSSSAMMKSALHVVVIFSSMLVELVFAGEASNTAIAANNWAARVTIFEVLGTDMTVSIRLPGECQFTIRMITPLIFDVTFEMLFESVRVQKGFARLAGGAVVPATVKRRFTFGSVHELGVMGVLMVGDLLSFVKA
jgi:hypothetical protein